MSLMMLLALGGRKLVTQTFTANATWMAPVGLNFLTASGKGAAGTPAIDGSYTRYYIECTSVTFYTNRNGTTSQDPPVQQFKTEVAANATKPNDYCDPPENSTDAGTSWSQRTMCYYYFKTEETVYTNTPATTGAAATGFGKTFPGGVGGPAVVTTFDKVAVTPGTNYPLVIPPGGSITIAYLK